VARVARWAATLSRSARWHRRHLVVNKWAAARGESEGRAGLGRAGRRNGAHGRRVGSLLPRRRARLLAACLSYALAACHLLALSPCSPLRVASALPAGVAALRLWRSALRVTYTGTRAPCASLPLAAAKSAKGDDASLLNRRETGRIAGVTASVATRGGSHVGKQRRRRRRRTTGDITIASAC